MKTRSAAPIHLITAVPALAVVGTRGDRLAGSLIATGVWSSYSRRYGETWSVERPPEFTPVDEWWYKVAAKCQGGWRIKIISPNGSHLLTLTSFWQYVDAEIFRVLVPTSDLAKSGKTAGQPKRPWMGRLVLKGTPTIVGARCGKGSVTILSASNYADVPAHTLCRGVGLEPAGGWVGETDGGQVDVEPADHCLALTRWFRRLISTWVSEQCGPWGDTAGALGLSLWRATDGAKSVARHDREEALQVEAAALHGGRASVWYYGSVGDRSACPAYPADPPPEGDYPTLPGRAHKLDVRSLYPWLLATKDFPIKFQGIKRNRTPDELRGWLKYWGGIAVVKLRAQEPEYPVRLDDRTRYPLGDCTATLAGPELLAALERDEVLEVRTYLRYAMGSPFKRWGRFVLRKRTEAKAAGDPAAELLWKLVANAFGGKFAQRSRRWVPCPRESAPKRWGDYYISREGSAAPEARRALAGIPHRLLVGGPGGRLPAAVYAYLTSYGRLHTRGIRILLGAGVVLAQDTDGLWVTDEGLRRARKYSLLAGDGPGTLRLDESSRYARWWDARHYYSMGKWTLAGVASGWTLASTGVAREVRRVEPSAFGIDPADALILEVVKDRKLDRIQPEGRVGPDGWLIPTTIEGYGGQKRLKDGDRGEAETPAELKRRRKRK